jgi:hypothetical protein
MCKVGNSFAKRDMSGRHVFYVDKDIDRIVTYCEKDTIAVAQIFSSTERRFIDRRRNYSCLNKIWAVKF